MKQCPISVQKISQASKECLLNTRQYSSGIYSYQIIALLYHHTGVPSIVWKNLFCDVLKAKVARPYLNTKLSPHTLDYLETFSLVF